MSGEALNRNHCFRSALTAIDDWERATQGREPVRTARHGGHPQFHCGNPPPAADPSTRTHTIDHSLGLGHRRDAGPTSTRRPVVID
jgi:hypothetical protein